MSLDYKREIWPEIVYLTKDSADDALTARVLSRLPDAEVVELEDSKDPLSQINFPANGVSAEAGKFTSGKRKLMLTRNRGEWLKACPGTSQHVCCNLWIVNPGEGCPLDCTYCYLQSYLKRNPTLKLYTNTDEMLSVLEAKAKENPNRLFRVGTGELIDSLVWDDLTDSTLDLVPFFARIPNLMLELKSKFAFVDNLLSLKNEHNDKRSH